MTANLLAIPIMASLVTGVLCLLCRRSPAAQRLLSLAGCGLNVVASILVLAYVDTGGYLVLHVGGWSAPYGIALAADLLAALMILVSNIVALATSVYAGDGDAPDESPGYFYPLLQFLMMGVNGAFLTGDLFNLYVWFEVMLIASFVMLVLGGKREQIEGGFKYVTLNLFSSGLFLAGAGLMYAKAGTLNMADIAEKMANNPDSVFLQSTSVLLLVAFGLKAAVFPLFFWLPASYHTPAPAVSALFAGLLTKVGVYALIRLFTLLFYNHAEDARELLVWIAALTMVTGVLGAAAQFDMRRILSFHIVSQIGYMIMGLAIGTPLALAGTVFYVLHHIVVKTNLFFVAGIVEKLRGTGDLARVGGLSQALPFLAILFFIPAFSLGGIPPLSGFWAKFALLKAALLDSYFMLAATALLVGLMTLFSMTKIWGEAFWKPDPAPLPEGAPAPKPGLATVPAMTAPVVLLAALTVLLSLWSAPVFSLAQDAAAQLLTPQDYIDAVLRPIAQP